MNFRIIFIFFSGVLFLTNYFNYILLFNSFTPVYKSFNFINTFLQNLSFFWMSGDLFFIIFLNVGLIIRILFFRNFSILLFIIIYSYSFINYNNLIEDLSFLYLNNQNENILLSNKVNLIHPPLLYSSITFLTKIERSKYSGDIKLVSFFVISITASLLGCWWAFLEGTWGGWWNWDISESLTLLPLLYTIFSFHSKLLFKSHNYFFINYSLFFIFFLIFYSFTQLDFIKTSHDFLTSSFKNLLFSSILFIQLFSLKSYLLSFGSLKLKRNAEYNNILIFIIIILIALIYFSQFLIDIIFSILKLNIYIFIIKWNILSLLVLFFTIFSYNFTISSINFLKISTNLKHILLKHYFINILFIAIVFYSFSNFRTEILNFNLIESVLISKNNNFIFNKNLESFNLPIFEFKNSITLNFFNFYQKYTCLFFSNYQLFFNITNLSGLVIIGFLPFSLYILNLKYKNMRY